MEITGTRTVYGIRSESTSDGIVWHMMEGWKDDLSSFATWTRQLATYSDYRECKRALRTLEGRA
jgi:hypothetical protein